MGVLDKVQGLLGSPLVQGAALGIMTGFPGAGLLAVPSLQGHKDRRLAENEERRRRIEARRGITGLLGESTTVQAPPRVGTLEGVDQDELISIPSPRQSVPSYQTPEGQQQMLGLLSQAEPEAFAQAMTGGLLSPSVKDPMRMKIRALEDALGRPLAESELLAISGADGKDASLTDLLATIQAQTMQQDLEQARREAESQSRQTVTDRMDRHRLVRSEVDAARRLYELNTALTGTLLENGFTEIPFIGNWGEIENTIRSRFGENSAVYRQARDFQDEFKKLAENIGLGIGQAKGLTSGTVAQLGSIERMKPSTAVTDIANNKIAAQHIETMLHQDEVERTFGNPIFSDEERAELIALVKEMKRDREVAPVLQYNPATGRVEQP